MSKYTYRKAGGNYYLIKRGRYTVGAMWRVKETGEVFTYNDIWGRDDDARVGERGPYKTLKEGIENFNETQR